jgi:cytochrome-b5 reductase
MIAGGTGITPMFQIIQKVANSTFDRTGLSLLYATNTIEELAFLDDLIKYDKKGKLNFYPIVNTPNSDKWMYGSGKINEDMIKYYMPDPKGNFYFFNLIFYFILFR